MARPTGSKNKATSELRDVVGRLVEENSHRFQAWLDDIEKDHGPLEAFKRVEALLEFCLPKLARTESHHSGEVKTSATVTFVNKLSDPE